MLVAESAYGGAMAAACSISGAAALLFTDNRTGHR
jgi:hypothetical protein